MDFKRYRQEMGWTLEEAADLLRLGNASTVQKHEEGKRMPRPEIIERYVKLTGGKVTADDFRAVYLKRKREQRARNEAAPAPA